MSFSVDMDYTKLGKVQLKIIVLGNDHAEVITRAGEIIRNQQHFIKSHKEQLDNDRASYKNLMFEQFEKVVSASQQKETNKDPANVPVTFDPMYS